MRKFILFILIALISFSVFADGYYYCIIKAKLKQLDEDIVLDIPFTIYHYTIWSNGKDMTYSGRVKDADVIALVAVQDKDKDAIKKWSGFVCDTWDELKAKKEYTDNYKLTVKDMKRQYDEKTDTVIEYKGLDKDEPAKFAEWIESVETGLEEDVK